MTSNYSSLQKQAQPLLKSMKKVPSQLVKDQESGRSMLDQFQKPKIIQHFNITDNSIYSDSQVDIDEPLFQPEPHVIQFTNYEPLQVKEQILKLRNKDKVARSVKIVPPDSKLFQVQPCKKAQKLKSTKKATGAGFAEATDIDNMSCRVAPGMEISFLIKFSPEAKSDYSYDLMVLTEREKFIVPIRAVGCRAMLDFPDVLDFGQVPVKHVTEKPVMIRNVGEKTTKWKIKVPSGFELSKQEGILQVGQSEQLVFQFIPQESRAYRDEVILSYDHLEAAIPIRGESHNDNVYLSKSHIHMDPTSITLYSHQYYTIVNKSQVPIEFSWRAFATEKEENEKKMRLNMQLSQEEAEERAMLESQDQNESGDESLDSDDSYDEAELQLKRERAQEKAIATLQRKYQGIRKAVEDDPMLFQDEIFTIEPLQGKIWPNTEITCCVTFKPQGPYHYSCTAFCNTTCSEERLALNMTGQGKGPQAQLSLPEQDIGDVFVNDRREFAVGIENTGEIDCHWKLIPYETPFGSKFHFSKTEGILGVDQNVRDLIKVTFKSDILGEFSETFRFALEGSSEMLTLTFKGHVVAPTFQFSEEIIDFGRVSYRFPIKKTVYLTNTSEVDINYVVRVPGDGRSLQSEFNIGNDRGRLERSKEAKIDIEFVPSFPQLYDMVLVVDLEGVGQDMLAVPIKAECLVPKVKVSPADFLEYDTCFLRHPKTRPIEIINEDSLQARYEIVPQDDQSKRIAVYTADKEGGIIPPKSSQIVNIALRTEILSTVRIPLYVKVEGHAVPSMLTVLATSTGPLVEADREELDYGNVEVLKDYTERLTIKNKSKIPAEYTAFTKQKESIWKVIQRHGVLQPDDEREIEVVCNADEVQKFQDTLHIIINNGVDLEVALRAKGTGSTLYCKTPLATVDFGTEYTHQNVTKEFFLENRGRKQMKILWQTTTKLSRKNQKKVGDAKAGESGKKGQGANESMGTDAKDDEEVKFVFQVVPESMVLNPKMGYKVQFRANSFNVGKVLENWQCQATIGGDRKPKVAFNTNVTGEFITPSLTFSEPRLYFKYLWEKGVASMPITKTLSLANAGPLPTTVNLRIDPPFSCGTERLTLANGEPETISIDFDPGMKQDRLSDNISGKLTIAHANHPHRDVVQLQGEVCFPNLQILPPNIDFGCILNDTSKRKYLVLTNISEMPVSYEWSFLEEETNSLNAVQEEDETRKRKKKPKSLPVNEVFDILPVSGRLEPGQTENVEFTFQAGHGLLYNGIAVCSVDGGPDYEVPIIGESSFVDFKLSTQELDYGEIPYNESSSKEFFIENIGKVPFEFSINLSTVSRPGIIECSQMSGKVIAGERFRVAIKFFPGVPDNIDEMLLVECGHFPAARFKVKAVGIYPGCLLSFPRANDEDYQGRLERAKSRLEQAQDQAGYAAPFSSAEAVRLMPSLPAKMAEKEKAMIKDQAAMTYEVEADRELLCEKIVAKLGQAQYAQAMGQTSGSGFGATAQRDPAASSARGAQPRGVVARGQGAARTRQPGAAAGAGSPEDRITVQANVGVGGAVNLESISIATYVCDFGNVVVGSTKRKSFRLTNVGRIPVTFNFDKKLLTQAGIAIDPDKVQKVMPNASTLFNVVLNKIGTTRKNAKYGKQRYVVPVDVKGGPSYLIEFGANLTIPELAMSTENLDFGKVCVQTRKTVKIRFENQKEVPCDWHYHSKPDISAAATAAKEGERFQVLPLLGVLLPGQRQTVDVMFTPNGDKQFQQKLTFKCSNNNGKQFVLNVKGQGIHYQVDPGPETVHLGPVLPYDTSAVQCIELRNPMDQAIEVVSQDFDAQYLDEEEILKRLEHFQAAQPEPLFLPLRAPGGEFWPALREQDDKRRKADELKEQLVKVEAELVQLTKEEQALNQPAKEEEQEAEAAADKEPLKTQEEISERRNELTEQKGKLEAALAEEQEDRLEVKYPAPVKEEDKLNLVIIGPEKCGKTTLANYLAQEHQRGVVRLDQLFDWCLKRGSQLAEEASKYLERRAEELATLQAEQEKRKKAKKKGKEEEPELNPEEYVYLSKDILIRMLKERLAQEDCNAGAIFDCLESKYWQDTKFAVELICEAVPQQSLQVLLLRFQREAAGAEGDEEPAQVCTNYRYARRKERKQLGRREDGPQEADTTEAKKKPKKAAASKTGAKARGQKGAPKEGDDGAEQLEAERQQKEEEERKKKLEEETRAQQKPKDYSSEEMEEYLRFADEMQQFFGEITARQLGAGLAEDAAGLVEAAADQEGGEPADQENEQLEEGAASKEGAGEAEAKPAGKRILVPHFIEYDFKFLCDSAKVAVPEPLWPDPDKEPLAPPVIHQIVRRPPARPERKEITMFSIWTPLPEAPRPASVEEGQVPAEEGDAEAQDALPPMTKDQARWVLGPKEAKKLYIKFFSQRVGAFSQVLKFEIVGSLRTFDLSLQAGCEFPTINQFYRNVFMTHKKTRPAQQPESLLSKTFVVSENTFDFGPLLIKKDPELRNSDDTMRQVNSSVLQITNNGKYKVDAAFTLRSTLPAEEGGSGEKSPFILEPETMELEVDETKHLTVFAFPDQARLFKDEIVCLLKDNPNPTIFSIQALGAEPVVEVDQDVVAFDRLLLGKKLTKTLALKNVCPIPTNWKLSGVDALPEEFAVSHTSGTLKPCQEQIVEITFEARAEDKFEPQISLEVEDTEGHGIQQEVKLIKIQAEAFKISPNVVIGKDDGQVLDFGAVRVGEPKENTITIKNDGKYPIKYNFTRKKKLTREIFTVEPEQDELKPQEEKTITVRFLSQKEIKLKTTTQTSDVILNILEGESQDVHQPIPINVNVNAVFSKYSITPLKTINFGPMQYGEQVTRSFEVRNEGLFEFKYAICDDQDLEAKAKIKEERHKEMEERINGTQEAPEDPKAAKGKKPDPKAKGKAPAGKEGAVPDGTQLTAGQYDVTPSTGSIPPGNAAVVSVTFRADGAKFYESTLAVDIADRDPQDQAEGIPFELCAESSIPGINTEDLDQVFEEQTVIPSLDPSLNTQTIISSSLYSTQERVFWFGTLVASKNPEGAKERFKIMNPNKIPCTVKFSVKPRSQSKSEGFAFEVSPDTLTIDPHKHKYVTVGFNPTAMMTYGGIFEALVENGDPESKSGKLVFELRGEGTLPTLLVEKPEEVDAEGTPVLRFRKTRIGRDATLSIVLKNEGQVPATARFDALQHDCFSFLGNLSHTITPKSYHAFDIRFAPKQAQNESFLLTFSTLNNPYEQHKVLIAGEGYSESVTFEGLPDDELAIGDCIVGKQKTMTFQLANNGDKAVRFRWNCGDKEEFRLFPSEGHLKAHSSKQVKVAFRSSKAIQYDQVELACETVVIEQKPAEEGIPTDAQGFRDWDDTMKTVRMVRPSELRKIMAEREAEERRRREEAEAAQAAAAKGKAAKGGKAPPKKDDAPAEEEVQIDESEEPTAELIDTIPEPEHEKVEASERAVALKTTLVCDYARYECVTTRMDFKPTLMYAQRTHKFTIKNTSLINLHFNFKIVNPETGILDAGAYSIFPKKGSVAPGCDDNFLVRFAPMEIEADFARSISANFLHLDPAQQPLDISVHGVAERPVIHFELPPSTYRERKEKDMTPVDSKYKIIEFESLGTSIKNTRRFMAVNPTGQGYEFEWEEVPDEARKNKPVFKCLAQRGVILSGKKAEMVFEYTPDNVGEHESHWIFRIPAENIVQHFLVVGRVNEPNVLFETGKIKFGPLLLQGKNREVVSLINQEHIPFSFSFAKESVKGSPDFGDSLRVSPMSGVVPAQSQVPVEVLFQPKYELQYNYNLTCNVKRKARPLVLNVKGEGYKIHHSVFAGSSRVEMQSGEPHKFDFGEFFINEKKTKKVVVQNNGEFNFDFVWKRQINKYITITPETGSVPKGEELEFEVTYLPIGEHHLKNYKLQLQIVSGPKYDFQLLGRARKPGIKLSSTTVDFGPCFVTRQPVPLRKMLVVHNVDSSAISVETDFEKKPHLDVLLTPGQVLMPDSVDEADKQLNKLQIPILFTPRDIRSYQETVTFDFNNLYKVDVLVKGEGIPLQLELKDPDQAFLDFGIVSVGGDVTKTVPLVNRSKKPVTFRLRPSDASQFQKCNVTFVPDGEVTLKPREVLPVEVRFHPKARLPNFHLDILLEVEPNEPRKMISLHGVSHGIELKLMDEVVAFGSVVRGSRLTKSLQLSNFGDVKAYYKWESKQYSKNFTISPESGYINPNSNLDLEVTFHPGKADPDIRYSKVPCWIKGGDKLELTLMGKSVEQDTSTTEELTFTTKVRQTTSQSVTVQNTEDKEWAINPTISTTGDGCKGYFTGRSTLVVPARGSAQYEVAYTPQTMTKLRKVKKQEGDQEVEVEEVQTHQGGLFFPLPNGTALLYRLVGTANEPDAEGELQETVTAKRAKSIIIPVKNWSRVSQRFHASWKVEGEADPALFIRGANAFDVGGQSTKEYKLNFLSLKSGRYRFQATFKAEKTGEYAFYHVDVTVEEPELVGTIELASQVREAVSQVISIENPTEIDVTIPASEFQCDNEYIEITPATLTVPARSERGFEVHYRPLIASEDEACDLVLQNAVLGAFKYKLLLKGLQPSSQRSLAFKCALGGDLVQAFKFTHYQKKPTNYTVKVERIDQPGAPSDFKAEVAQVSAPAAESHKGVEVSCSIRYEPFTIGDSRGVLKLASPDGMDYTCLLFGKSTAPQPQGPIKCPAGAKPAAVDFKNPLNEKCEFLVTFDNANFSLASKLPGPLDPGKVTSLQVKFDAKPELPRTGRMMVSTKGLPPWVFYLQGE